MKPWHFRHARSIVLLGGAAAATGVAIAAVGASSDRGQALVAARQLYGLWALALLLASMTIGPLAAVFPRLPLRAPLLYARRTVGIGAFAFAVLHVGCYSASVLRRSWRELYTPGALWVAGLLLGAVALVNLSVLTRTSCDASVRRLGGRRWKRLHRTVYLVLVVVLLHGLLVGADFGLNRGPDVVGQPDAGSLVAFLCVSAAWLTLFLLRRRGGRVSPSSRN